MPHRKSGVFPQFYWTDQFLSLDHCDTYVQLLWPAVLLSEGFFQLLESCESNPGFQLLSFLYLLRKTTTTTNFEGRNRGRSTALPGVG